MKLFVNIFTGKVIRFKAHKLQEKKLKLQHLALLLRTKAAKKSYLHLLDVQYSPLIKFSEIVNAATGAIFDRPIQNRLK